MKYLISVLVIFIVNEKCFGLSFPEYYERCQVSEALDLKPNECLKTSIGKALKILENGDIALDVPSFDPLKVNRMTFKQGEAENPVNIVLKLRNIDLLGLSNFVVNWVGGKLSTPKNWNLTINGDLPELQLIGDYKIDGKVLILPIVGSGKCNITFSKLDISLEAYGQSEIINGQEYLKIVNHKFSQNLKRVYLYFGNLFNGNALLGDSTNRFFNDNWNLIYTELRPTVEKEIAKVVAEYAKNVMGKVPFNEMFIVES